MMPCANKPNFGNRKDTKHVMEKEDREERVAIPLSVEFTSTDAETSS
jgi:hypothetical protein